MGTGSIAAGRITMTKKREEKETELTRWKDAQSTAVRMTEPTAIPAAAGTGARQNAMTEVELLIRRPMEDPVQ